MRPRILIHMEHGLRYEDAMAFYSYSNLIHIVPAKRTSNGVCK